MNTCKPVWHEAVTNARSLASPSLKQPRANGVTVKESAGGSTSVCPGGAHCRPSGSEARSGEASVPQDIFQPSGVSPSLPNPCHCCGTSRLLVPSNGKGSGGTRFILCFELKTSWRSTRPSVPD